MADTPNLTLPVLAAAQAQKHVTVNEAVARIDALAQLRILSRGLTVPPTGLEGQCYAVPAGAVNAWAGKSGKVAIFLNGGWSFATPQTGWRAFIVDESAEALHDGSDWRANTLAFAASGAGSAMKAVEINHAIGAGATSTTAVVFPANAMVLGVTGRVTTAITGTLTSWSLGVAGSPGRFGTGLGLSVGSFVLGTLSQPTTEYAPVSLLLTGTGGAFTGGNVRLVAHFMVLSLPNP